MRGIEQFAHLMPSTVSIAPRFSLDSQGKPPAGTAVTYRGRLVGKRELVRTAGGQEVESKQQFHVMSRTVIQPTSIVTLSTGDVGSTEATATSPKILASVPKYDGSGIHHSVLFF